MERSPGLGRRLDPPGELGGDHVLVAVALDRAADQLLVGHRAVELRGVQEVDPQLERPLDRGHRLALVGRAVEGRHAHAAEPEGRDLERSELALLHGFSNRLLNGSVSHHHRSVACEMAKPAEHGEAVELAVGERTVRISSPDRVYFSARGETKLDLARYYMSVGDGIVRALRERPCMLHRFPRGSRRREGPPEAPSPGGARLGRDRPRPLPPLWPPRRRAVRDRAGQRDLGRADVDGRVPPLELAPRRRRAPRRVADRHRPDARLPASTGQAGGPRGPRGAGRAGRHRLAQDLGRLGHPRLRPDRAALGVRRGAAGGAGLRPRGGAPGPRRRDHDLVAQGPRARQGVRRLQPERPRPHDRQRLLGARGRARARSRPRSPGRRSTTSSRAS